MTPMSIHEHPMYPQQRPERSEKRFPTKRKRRGGVLALVIARLRAIHNSFPTHSPLINLLDGQGIQRALQSETCAVQPFSRC